VPGDTGKLARPARVLLGWMPAAQGELFLVSNTIGVQPTPEQRERARQAREAVAARPLEIDQADLVSALPSELADHVARLRQSPAGAGMFEQGWDVAMVDLERVCAFQPKVFIDTVVERVEGIKSDNLEAIAEITLPTTPVEPPQMQFDPSKPAFMVVSPNPNLTVIGNLTTDIQDIPGAQGLGFIVRVMPTSVQVVRFQGRYYLRDGYHRAYALLDRGITRAPVFIRDMDAIEELVPRPQGMLPQNAYCGARPPLLHDYHNDLVAETVRLPAEQKLIVIQALELAPHG